MFHGNDPFGCSRCVDSDLSTRNPAGCFAPTLKSSMVGILVPYNPEQRALLFVIERPLQSQ